MEYETVDAADLLNGDIVVSGNDETATVRGLAPDGAQVHIMFYGQHGNITLFPDDPVTIVKRP